MSRLLNALVHPSHLPGDLRNKQGHCHCLFNPLTLPVPATSSSPPSNPLSAEASVITTAVQLHHSSRPQSCRSSRTITCSCTLNALRRPATLESSRLPSHTAAISGIHPTSLVVHFHSQLAIVKGATFRALLNLVPHLRSTPLKCNF